MQDSPNGFDTPMLGLEREAWLAQLEHVAEEHGHYQPLGPNHVATLVEDKPVLLITFETMQSIQERGETGQPLGWELVRELGWSHLCILSDGDTWFRDPAVIAYFDRLSDDGFFEEFDRVVFYGEGSCGYAAAAFSLAAPGATVIASRPQATLAPSIAGWDHRYPQARRLNFEGSYGYAPDMLEAAESAYIIYDPSQDVDAMHATLFRGQNVELLATPRLGAEIENSLLEMQILFRILAKAGSGKMSRSAFFKLYRARRNYLPYLNQLLNSIDGNRAPFMKAMVCANVARRLHDRRFLRKLNRLVQQADEGRLAS